MTENQLVSLRLVSAFVLPHKNNRYIDGFVSVPTHWRGVVLVAWQRSGGGLLDEIGTEYEEKGGELI